jgi:hypothetical protein
MMDYNRLVNAISQAVRAVVETSEGCRLEIDAIDIHDNPKDNAVDVCISFTRQLSERLE